MSSAPLASNPTALPLQLPTSAGSSSGTVFSRLDAGGRGPSVRPTVGAAQVPHKRSGDHRHKYFGRALLLFEPLLSSATNAANTENSAAPQPCFQSDQFRGKWEQDLRVSSRSEFVADPSSALAFLRRRCRRFAGTDHFQDFGRWRRGIECGIRPETGFACDAERSGCSARRHCFCRRTLNGTIRSIAGADSSEPGIVRSVVGRLARGRISNLFSRWG